MRHVFWKEERNKRMNSKNKRKRYMRKNGTEKTNIKETKIKKWLKIIIVSAL